jgi:hypothetical protein
MLQRQHDAGIGLIRQPFAWSDFEKDPKRYDDFVGAVERHGLRVLPVVLGPEPGGAPAGHGPMKPPSDVEAYARFAAALVKRYPSIRSWQIWNEPNIGSFWGGRPDPAAYAKLLGAASAAIRKVDPKVEIVTAGLPTSHLGIPGPEFLDAMYTAGAKGAFDTAAVHAYAPTPDTVLQRVRDMRKVIDRNGDDAPVWVTEVGWGTGGEPGPLTVTPEKQATYIAETVRRLKAARAELKVRGVVIFQWKDPKPFPGRREIWPYHAGLLDRNGNPKPALKALEAAVSG